MDSDHVLLYKGKMPLLHKLTGIIFIIVILLKGALIITNRFYDIYFFAGKVIQNEVDLILNVLIVALIVFYMHRVWMKIIIVAIGTIFILAGNLNGIFNNAEPLYYYMDSPNQMNTLIIEENALGLAGWSNIYVKLNGLFVKKLDEISTKDGHQPFLNEDFELIWIDDNEVILTYWLGDGEIHTKKVTIDK